MPVVNRQKERQIVIEGRKKEMSDEQIKQAVLKFREQTVPPVPQQKAGITADLQSRIGRGAEAFERGFRGEQTLPESILQATGQAGAFLTQDVPSRAISGAFGLLPDPAEEAIKRFASSKGAQFLQTTAGQIALEAVQKGVDAYQDFKEKNPRAAANLEATVNVAALIPFTKGAQITAQKAIDITKTSFRATKNAVGLSGNTATQLSRKLEETSLRLTPVQKQNYAKKLDDITDFISGNKITGSPARRFDKIDNLYESTEDELQNFLKDKAKTVFVNKQAIIARMKSIPVKYADERDFGAITKQVDSAIDSFEAQFPDEIPVVRLNIWKRSTYRDAYNKAGEKVLDFVEHDLGDVAKEKIEESLKGMTIKGLTIENFNKKYGTLINARKLLKIAQTRPQIGLVGKLVSSYVGAQIGVVVGGPIGAATGAAIGTRLGGAVAGTRVRSAISTGLRRFTK